MQNRFVFFDLGDTLVRKKRPVLEYCVQIAAIETGTRLDSDDKVQQAILEFKRAEMDQWNATPAEKLGYIKDDRQEQQFLQEFYVSVIQRLGQSHPTRDSISLLAEIQSKSDSFELFEDVAETLELLRQQNTILGIISNAFPSAKSIIETLGLKRWFKYIILSYQHEFLPKPYPQIYKHAIKQTKVKPRYADSILFVDDRLHFVKGAAEPGVGMSAFLIDRDCMTADCPGYVNRGAYKKIVDLREIPAYINRMSYQLPLFASSIA